MLNKVSFSDVGQVPYLTIRVADPDTAAGILRVPITIKHLSSVVDPGMFIPNPHFSIPDPVFRVKKVSDPQQRMEVSQILSFSHRGVPDPGVEKHRIRIRITAFDNSGWI